MDVKAGDKGSFEANGRTLRACVVKARGPRCDLKVPGVPFSETQHVPVGYAVDGDARRFMPDNTALVPPVEVFEGPAPRLVRVAPPSPWPTRAAVTALVLSVVSTALAALSMLSH